MDFASLFGRIAGPGAAPDARLVALKRAIESADRSAQLTRLPEANQVLASEGRERVDLLLQVLALLLLRQAKRQSWLYHHVILVSKLANALVAGGLPAATEAELADALDACGYFVENDPVDPLLDVLDERYQERELSSVVAIALSAYLERLAKQYNNSELRKIRERGRRLLRAPSERDAFYLERVDAWTAQLLDELAQLEENERERLRALLMHCTGASASKPSKLWTKHAKALVDSLGAARFAELILPVLERVATDGGFPVQVPGFPSGFADGDPTLISARHAQLLRGLVWTVACAATPELVQALGDAAERCFKKVPNIGPRAPKIGNACLVTLSSIESVAAIGQISRLEARVKHRSSRTQVERALGSVALRSGLSVEELADLSVPTCGLTGSGRLERTLGDFKAVVEVSGTSDIELTFRTPDGKWQKSIPARLKQEQSAELKLLKTQLKELATQLPTQIRRLETLLLSERTIPFSTWRERFAAHPLVGYLARKLVWSVGSPQALAGFDGERWCDLDGRPLEVADNAPIGLWHPITSTPEIVLAWRQCLSARQITQPFKQAHRELYLLTDAERETRDYSNRFAAHVLKQHQFSALCRERGWSYDLQGQWDSHNTPFIDLPQHQLRVEYWVEPLSFEAGEMGGTGVFLHVATDQVRFVSRVTSEAVPLVEVPPRVFSELMRDVDLFVGVASVGNDPNWQDGGRRDDLTAYWQSFAFGELGETAKTRRTVLIELLPKLKIAPVCSIEQHFLVVRGKLRTYRIHLGSANIQMEPNNQYLCVVPDRSSSAKRPSRVHLPFEGDRTLSLILSKAILLADDQRIDDPTIQSQIGSHHYTH